MCRMVLVQDRVRTLEIANHTISKRRRAKRTFIQDGGTLNLETARDILAAKDVEEQITLENRTNGGGEKRISSALWRCSKCGKTGHSARICQSD